MKEGEHVRAARILLETGLEAESDHACGEFFGSHATGRLAHGEAALLVESVQRGMQGGDGLRRQGVFDAGFLPAQAFEEVERDAARPSFGRLENTAAGQHEGEAGDAFEAAVRAAERFRVDACGAEGDACVDEERPARSPAGTADFTEVVPESRDGIDVDDGDVRDVGTLVEKHGDLGRVRSLIESRLELLDRNVRTREHAAGGFSTGSVADDEYAALFRDERRERSFEREGAGTRRQDGSVFGGTHARDTLETSAHVLHHRDECGIGGRRTAGHGLEDE